MDRRIALMLVVVTLVVEARSDDVLKCYMCTSKDDGCDSNPETSKLQPVECTIEKMISWQNTLLQHNVLKRIATLFEVDHLQSYQGAPKDMACAKMNFKVSNQDVTVRSCQTAKAENLDPCKAIEAKLGNLGTMEYCGLCEQDQCNGSIAASPAILNTIMSILVTFAAAILYRAA